MRDPHRRTLRIRSRQLGRLALGLVAVVPAVFVAFAAPTVGKRSQGGFELATPAFAFSASPRAPDPPLVFPAQHAPRNARLIVVATDAWLASSFPDSKAAKLTELQVGLADTLGEVPFRQSLMGVGVRAHGAHSQLWKAWLARAHLPRERRHHAGCSSLLHGQLWGRSRRRREHPSDRHGRPCIAIVPFRRQLREGHHYLPSSVRRACLAARCWRRTTLGRRYWVRVVALPSSSCRLTTPSHQRQRTQRRQHPAGAGRWQTRSRHGAAALFVSAAAGQRWPGPPKCRQRQGQLACTGLFDGLRV